MFKLTLVLFSLLTVFNTYADELPWCSDPKVRLSIFKIPCKKDPRLPSEFDIPELKIDFENLHKIYEGAESSGGHVVGPMNYPRRTRPLTPFALDIRCEARLLADGGKSISFLSIQKSALTEQRYSTYLYENNWKHYLTEENDLNPSRLVEVPVAPAVEVGNYTVNLAYKEAKGRQSEKLILSVCEANLGQNDKGATGACAEVERPLYKRVLKARLKTVTSNMSTNLKIQKTLQVTCIRN